MVVFLASSPSLGIRLAVGCRWCLSVLCFRVQRTMSIVFWVSFPLWQVMQSMPCLSMVVWLLAGTSVVHNARCVCCVFALVFRCLVFLQRRMTTVCAVSCVFVAQDDCCVCCTYVPRGYSRFLRGQFRVSCVVFVCFVGDNGILLVWCLLLRWVVGVVCFVFVFVFWLSGYFQAVSHCSVQTMPFVCSVSGYSSLCLVPCVRCYPIQGRQ